MKTRLMILAIVLITIASQGAYACEPSAYFLFHDDARNVLDSLEQSGSSDYFLMGILAHNISFSNHDEDMTKKAKKYFKKCEPNCDGQNLVEAYRGSQELLHLRDRNKISSGWKFGWSKIGLAASPYDEVRKAFQRITDAVDQQPVNIVIRFLCLTAALESAAVMPEFLATAKKDLHYLDGVLRYEQFADSIHLYFLHMSWVKYWYRAAEISFRHGQSAWNTGDSFASLGGSQSALLSSKPFACKEWHHLDIELWERRIEELRYEIEQSE
ncbi:hypothetical protein ACFL0L_02525 [Patescibacteria group bacterium]